MTDFYQGREIPAINADVASRFWDKCIPEPNSGCLIWLGASNEAGYGSFWAHGKCRKAHRVAYAIENGGAPAGLDVMHKCDTPACVNPGHLRAAPTSENVKDAFNKGRLHRRGDKNSRTKIADQMIPIVKRLSDSGVETTQIAYAFDVDQSTVRRCLRNERKTA